MTYAKIDDNAPWSPKVAALSDSEFRAWITSICYASQFRTDGHVPEHALRVIGATTKTREGLVDKGMWEPNGSGVYVHDYLEHQRSREQIAAISEQRRGAATKRWQ